jgi:hypothetical protein
MPDFQFKLPTVYAWQGKELLSPAAPYFFREFVRAGVAQGWLVLGETSFELKINGEWKNCGAEDWLLSSRDGPFLMTHKDFTFLFHPTPDAP